MGTHRRFPKRPAASITCSHCVLPPLTQRATHTLRSTALSLLSSDLSRYALFGRVCPSLRRFLLCARSFALALSTLAPPLQ
eukprot:3765942-Pleurochrysis_carterae.AAC.1